MYEYRKAAASDESFSHRPLKTLPHLTLQEFKMTKARGMQLQYKLRLESLIKV